MICPNCKERVPDKINYCNHCGEKLSNKENNKTSYNDLDSKSHEKLYKYSKNYSNITNDISENHDKQYFYSEMYSNTNSYQITSDEDYIKLFIKNNYNTIKQEKFSIPALIFGPFYLLYRKLYYYGILLIIIISIITYYNTDIASLIVIGINLYLGLKFNAIYIDYVNKKVDEIKISNPDKSSNELLELCKKKGGTSTIGRIIIIFLLILISIFLLYINNKNEEKQQENNQQKNKYDIIKNMTYEVPENFEVGKYQSDYFKFYSYRSNTEVCLITMNTTKEKNEDTKEYQNEKNTIIINNIPWEYEIKEQTISYKNNFGNNLYEIQFQSSGVENTTCEKAKEQLLDSIRFSN